MKIRKVMLCFAFILSFFILSNSGQVHAESSGPENIILFRHCEKSKLKYKNLTPRGKLRAQGIANLFIEDAPEDNCLAEFLKSKKDYVKGVYAYSPDRKYNTIRTIESAQPTAYITNNEVNAAFDKRDLHTIKNDIMSRKDFNNKTVVLFISYGTMPEITKLFVPEANFKKQNIYDRAVVIFKTGKKTYDYTILPQKIFYKDTDYPVDLPKSKKICPNYYKHIRSS